jgi:hypothetical protein
MDISTQQHMALFNLGESVSKAVLEDGCSDEDAWAYIKMGLGGDHGKHSIIVATRRAVRAGCGEPEIYDPAKAAVFAGLYELAQRIRQRAIEIREEMKRADAE